VATWISTAWDWIKGAVTTAGDTAKSVWQEALGFILRIMRAHINNLIALWVGTSGAILAVFRGIGPAIQDIFLQAFNGVVSIVEDAVNKIMGAVNRVRGWAGLDPFENLNLGRIRNNAEGAARTLGQAVGTSFSEAFRRDFVGEAGDAVGGALGALTDRARAASANRRMADADRANAPRPDLNRALGTPGRGGADDDGNAAKKLEAQLAQLIDRIDPVRGAMNELAEAQSTLNRARAAGLITGEQYARLEGRMQEHFRDQIDPLGALNREMTRQLELTGLDATTRADAIRMHELEQDLRKRGVQLSTEERAQLQQMVALQREANQLMEARDQVLRQIRGPAQDFNLTIQALNQLAAQGRINAQEFADAWTTARLNFLQTQTDFASGLERGLLTIRQNLADLATTGEQLITGTFKDLEDAVVDFVTKGEFNLEKFWQNMLASSTRALFQMAANWAANQIATMIPGLGGGAASAGGGAAFSAQVAVAGTTFATAVTTAGATFAAMVAGQGAAGAAAGAAGSAGGSGGWLSAIASIFSYAGGFATGGSFTVPGSGAPDSQMVAMRLTPGERVDIRTPSQQREADAGQTQVAPQSIRVVNVLDPNEAVAAMGTSAGERVILNVIERNPATIARLLNR
jgi:hypothetical protein